MTPNSLELVALKAAIRTDESRLRLQRAVGLAADDAGVPLLIVAFDESLPTRRVELAREKSRFGYRRLHVLLRGSGEHVNHNKRFPAITGWN